MGSSPCRGGVRPPSRQAGVPIKADSLARGAESANLHPGLSPRGPLTAGLHLPGAWFLLSAPQRPREEGLSLTRLTDTDSGETVARGHRGRDENWDRSPCSHCALCPGGTMTVRAGEAVMVWETVSLTTGGAMQLPNQSQWGEGVLFQEKLEIRIFT